MRLAEELNREAQDQAPISFFNDYNYATNVLSPEEEVHQLENLWEEEGAATAIAEQIRRKAQDKEDYETQVHAKVPTRFERDDII